jgi:ariadne-1
MTHLKCNHCLCHDCYSGFVKNLIGHHGSSCLVNMKCFVKGCTVPIKEDFLKTLEFGSQKEYTDLILRFQKFRVQDLTDKSPNLFFCIAPDCDYVFSVHENEFQNGKTLPMKDSPCTCGYVMCLSCKEWGHEPLLCKESQEWTQKVGGSVDKLNTLWKFENSKKCPQCNIDVEKNGGCNKISCRCGHLFCWLCMSAWEVHGYSPCNLAKKFDQDSKDTPHEIVILQKFKFYVERFGVHGHSLAKNLEFFTKYLKVTNVEGFTEEW